VVCASAAGKAKVTAMVRKSAQVAAGRDVILNGEYRRIINFMFLQDGFLQGQRFRENQPAARLRAGQCGFEHDE
jgi:hypothetical protein